MAAHTLPMQLLNIRLTKFWLSRHKTLAASLRLRSDFNGAKKLSAKLAVRVAHVVWSDSTVSSCYV
jgi:hypothetical protein